MKEKYFDIYKNNKMYAKLVLVEFASVYIYSSAHWKHTKGWKQNGS